jgi:iron(III) transport system substrate-binding protein
MTTRLLTHALAAATLAALLVTPLPAQQKTVTVYSSRSHYGAESVFDDFTRQTGIKVVFFNGNNNEVFERLKAEGARTPADLLLTVDAGNLWNAAREGLLAPVTSKALDANVPAAYRDAGGRWFGIAVRARTIAYSTARVKPADVPTYESLGDPRWKGRLCLRSSTNIYNQSLLAALIASRGEARVEQMVRAWVANQPVYINGDTGLLQAIAAGQCDVGISNTYYLGRLLEKDPSLPVALAWADQQGAGVHVNVSGGGVTTHARNRAEAIALLEFLTSPAAQATLAGRSHEYPVNPAVAPLPMLAGWGTFKADAAGVAAAGAYQAAAVKLADRAGYR